MHEELQQLADRFARYAPHAQALSDAQWRDVASAIQVIIPAGGESKRLRGYAQQGHNKISTPLPNGDTLIEYNIRMYRDAGLTDFVLLVGHAADSVISRVGDGTSAGVSVRYSHDDEKPLATGGAIRLAMERGLLDKSKYMIVHNGGDIFVGYPGSLPRDLATNHLQFEKQGSVATMLSAPMSLVQGSVLKVVNGFVEHVTYESYVPMPYHAAATMFSPAAYDIFMHLLPPKQKIEFERTLFPYLAERKMLTTMKVANQYFLPVKNEKQWEQLMALFQPRKL